VLSDGVAETTIADAPAVRAICSSSSQRLLPIPMARNLADVEERQLGERRPEIRYDGTDPHELVVSQGTESDPAGVHVPLERMSLPLHRVRTRASSAHARALQFPVAR
jgi:hypothetical protein